MCSLLRFLTLISSVFLLLNLTHSLTLNSGLVFNSSGTGKQWTIPDEVTPDPVFVDGSPTTTRIIISHGYNVEKHSITTEDGYILSLFRIPSKGQPVLFLHGYAGTSDSWLIRNNTRQSLPFLLSDAGFDVWLGNARGNVYSKHHAYLSPNQAEFWDFSLHELGSQDLPAMIELIRYKSSHDQLLYVGYSWGGGTPYLMASTRPEYTRYIKLNILLAPFVLGPVSGGKSTLLHIGGYFLKWIIKLVHHLSPTTPFAYKSNLTIRLIRIFCKGRSFTHPICKYIVNDISGRDDGVNFTDLDSMILRLIGGCSMNSFAHIYQIYRTHRFGPISDASEEYDISRMVIPTLIWYSKNDRLVDEKGVKMLSQRTPRLLNASLIPYDQFTHLDYMLLSDEHYNHFVTDVMDQLKYHAGATESTDS